MDGTGTLSARTVAGRLLVFALLLVLFDVATGQVLDRLRGTVGEGMLVGQLNSALRVGADVLVLGTSTAVHHYDDRFLSDRLGLRVYNGGVDGRAVVFARGELSLVSAIHRPRLVVLDEGYSPDDLAHAQLLAPYYGRDPVVTEILARDWRNRVLLVSRAYRYDQLALPILSHVGTASRRWGFLPLEGSLPDTTSLAAGAERTDRGFGPWFGADLRRLVEEAHAGGTQVVFVEGPTWGNPIPRVAIAEYDRVARALGVPVLRLTPDRCPALADPALYRDRNHLNARGARLFTRMVGDSLEAMIVDGRLLSARAAPGPGAARPALSPPASEHAAGDGGSRACRSLPGSSYATAPPAPPARGTASP